MNECSLNKVNNIMETNPSEENNSFKNDLLRSWNLLFFRSFLFYSVTKYTNDVILLCKCCSMKNILLLFMIKVHRYEI